jgi:hypothetical protein
MDLGRLWPERDADLFGGIFDEALVARRYPRDLTLRVPQRAAALGGAELDAWFAAHRPPVPWKGTVSGVLIAADECSPDCPVCASWHEQHGAAGAAALAAFTA